MAGLNLNIGTSVVKREAKKISAVESRLLSDGWTRTGTALNGKVRYYQNSNFNITAMQGPLGTIIMPSGPIRGLIFGNNAVGINRTSVIGAGKKSSSGSSSGEPKTGPNQMI